MWLLQQACPCIYMERTRWSSSLYSSLPMLFSNAACGGPQESCPIPLHSRTTPVPLLWELVQNSCISFCILICKTNSPVLSQKQKISAVQCSQASHCGCSMGGKLWVRKRVNGNFKLLRTCDYNVRRKICKEIFKLLLTRHYEHELSLLASQLFYQMAQWKRMDRWSIPKVCPSPFILLPTASYIQIRMVFS